MDEGYRLIQRYKYEKEKKLDFLHECYKVKREIFSVEGQIDTESKKCNANISDIVTFLIQEVGKNVQKYASDVIYDINALAEALEKCEENKEFWFGLREMGVDNVTFINTRTSSPEVYGAIRSTYFAIYVVEVCVDKINNMTKITLKEMRYAPKRD